MTADRKELGPWKTLGTPAHSPTGRDILFESRGWQIRGFNAEHPASQHFAVRGWSHLQLWHEGFGISILTPSRLTESCFEIRLPDRRIARLSTREDVEAMLWDYWALTLPSSSAVFAAHRWFVDHMEMMVRGSGAVSNPPTPQPAGTPLKEDPTTADNSFQHFAPPAPNPTQGVHHGDAKESKTGP
jgi:hypothetical protein